MKNSPKMRVLALAIAAGMALPGTALATNGYFSHAYSVKAGGVAGAGIAHSWDTMDAAINPANMVEVGNQIDLGINWFSPIRSYTVEGMPTGFPGTFGLVPGSFDSSNENFFIPNFGWNMMIDEVSSVGVSIGGNGGMNTEYKDVSVPTPMGPFEVGTYGGGTVPGGNPVAGVDLMQLFVAPTYARKLTDNFKIGLTAMFVAARFKATGLPAFGGFSTDPTSLTDNGYETSYGFGGKIGATWDINEMFSLGGYYQSKVSMDEFDKYKGLFAEQGAFDVPATYGIGAALKPSKQHTVLFDVQRIDYSDVASISNPLLPNLGMCMMGMASSCLGGDDGSGFGWEDMTVYKLGYQYDAGDWQARVGFSSGDQPIPESEVLFNIIAPAVMEDHYTLGFTKKISDKSDLDFAFMYAPTVKVKGANPLEAPGAQNIEIQMKQYQFGVNYSWKF